MFQNKYILIRNLATIFIVCNMLYWIFPFPPIFWRVGLVLLCLYAVFFRRSKRQPCENAVLIFAVFNLLHFFVSFLWSTPTTGQIGNILCALMSFILFTYLGENRVLTEKYFTIIGVVLIVASILQFYQARATIIENLLLDSDADFTNNATVAFLFMLPMLFLIKNDLQKWAFLTICLFYLIAGAKRGNIVAAAIPTVLFVFSQLKNSRHSLIKTVFILGAIVVVSLVVYNWFITNDFMMHRLEQTLEGNSSGRDVIYTTAWHAWFDCNNFGHYLFGFGYLGTICHPLMHGYMAHNDWLEILVDYGLVGVALYLFIFISFAKMIWKTENTQLKLVMLSAVCIWFFKTLFSMGFSEGNMSILMISLGTAVGRNPLHNKGLIS